MSSDYTRVRNTENLIDMMGTERAKSPPTAGCPSCKAPLIGTMAFRRAEFYCLECGRTCGWLDPYKLDADEVEERMAALQAEWDEHVSGKLLSDSGWRTDCEKCGGGSGEYHIQHATDEEIEADKQAREWLKQRIRR